MPDQAPFAAARPDMLDLAFYPPAALAEATVAGDDVVLRFADGRGGRFDRLWLRDNCPCPACRHPKTLERRFLFIDEEEPRVERIAVTAEGHLSLSFLPRHDSLFDAGWLAAHGEGHAQPPAATPWTAATLPAAPSVTHAAMMDSDAGLAAFLDALTDRGLVVLTDGPTDLNEVERVARRVGPPRATNFGLIFDVVSRPDPNNSAYTAMGLELHGDLPNWGWPPDVQLLYCLANEATGGGSIFADGLAVTEALRRENPDAFALLATTPVLFRFHDRGDDIRHSAPILETDLRGQITGIRFNNWIRAALDLPHDKVRPWYGAYRAFWTLLRDPRFRLTLKLRAGEMVAFDNRRILHGREAFDPNSGRRHLQGTYLDRDAIDSRRRLLRRAAG